MQHRQIWKNPGDGPDIGYAAYGDMEGELVFFFHGWPACRFQARPAHEEARRRGLCLIAPDRPGVGLSGDQPGRGFSDWPPLIRALADDLGVDTFHILAVSGGCPYALATAAALPDRVGKVAICCGAPPLTEFPDKSDLFWVYRALMKASKAAPAIQYPLFAIGKPWMEVLPGNWSIRLLLGMVPKTDKEAIRREPNLTMVTQTVREAFRRPRGALLDGRLYLKPWDFDFREIRVPVAFWHGEADTSLPIAKTRWLSEQVPNAIFEAVPGEGHYSLPLKHHNRFLAWLAM